MKLRNCLFRSHISAETLRNILRDLDGLRVLKYFPVIKLERSRVVQEFHVPIKRDSASNRSLMFNQLSGLNLLLSCRTIARAITMGWDFPPVTFQSWQSSNFRCLAGKFMISRIFCWKFSILAPLINLLSYDTDDSLSYWISWNVRTCVTASQISLENRIHLGSHWEHRNTKCNCETLDNF